MCTEKHHPKVALKGFIFCSEDHFYLYKVFQILSCRVPAFYQSMKTKTTLKMYPDIIITAQLGVITAPV